MAQSLEWPELPYAAWQDTRDTLHLWTQIVGKIRLAQTPWLNHSWHVVLYVTARGLTTSPIAYRDRAFEIEFDFISHALAVKTSEGALRRIPLVAMPVAEFGSKLFAILAPTFNSSKSAAPLPGAPCTGRRMMLRRDESS